MRFSIETRHPFLDHRLVDFMLSLPVRMKIKNGWTKYVLRKAIHELPDAIRWRRDKQGFVTPEEKWLRSALVPDVFNELNNSMLDQMGILAKEKAKAHYEKFLKKDPFIHYSEISRLYLAELWAKMNFSN
jgi:asparagine synthase (glutamine-hydrolysing)